MSSTLSPHLQRGKSPSGLSFITTGPHSNITNPNPNINNNNNSNRTNSRSPILICIPGWACRAADFAYLLSDLAHHNPDDLQAYALDLPGHGFSPAALSPSATIVSFAQVVRTFIQEQIFPSVGSPQQHQSGIVLVGHSMGCRVAIEIWVQYHQTTNINTSNNDSDNDNDSKNSEQSPLTGIIFLDGSHYKLRKSTFAFDAGNPSGAGLSVSQKREAMAQVFGGMFGPLSPKTFVEEAVAHVRDMEFEYNSAERKGLLEYDYERLDSALEIFRREGKGCKMMNLQSTAVDDEGRRVSLKQGEVSGWTRHLMDRVPRVRLDVVEDASHFPHVDRPGLVREKIVDFVKRLDS